MKKCLTGILLATSFFFALKMEAQSHEVQQLLLNVEKLAQLKSILSDLKKGYNIVSDGYGTIKAISEGAFNLHQAFLDGLFEVSPVVKKYRRVGDIISTQLRLVADYKKAYRQFRESGHFTTSELQYFGKVYENLLAQSLKNLGALAKVITAGQLRMSDDERLTAIDAVWKEVEESYAFLQHFNSSAKLLALQRTKGQHEVDAVRNLYGIH